MIRIYEWVTSLIAIDQELFEIRLSLDLNENELYRWKNYSNEDGDLAKHQTFLTALQKQVRLKEVIESLATREEQLKKQRQDIIDTIEKFQGLDQRILKMKYVDGMKLESIAEKTGYTYQYIRSRHADIMKMIRFSKNV
ncbi:MULTISPECIES: sigma-70 family RNA polymerase sigma factor [unclassified Enterococcus]|uniref:sigma-70 family RNA polymerase sigma factor n=1 Tax=unclassified Enterococcus TaxID=2608891 RepID=UPI0019077D7B|nr:MULTISPECIES: sigma-70 family RNA polymerase sigma factor [unclassified Enterococcus]MBK0036693.1 sigma-70 family RNA polymerase sigma factor [Enterococcus sp. S52]MBK0069356.1 sigma-70 family RNA polymerase sigma factor [Enterococcus sp. S53]MBK0139949.1 sigma-70 family RNA polymerase sigma factor [Enterococcus sp. S76]MBK0143592.1 sigma-70 family RNA polymerase sigma factor [Enterococcus sp. S77]